MIRFFHLPSSLLRSRHVSVVMRRRSEPERTSRSDSLQTNCRFDFPSSSIIDQGQVQRIIIAFLAHREIVHRRDLDLVVEPLREGLSSLKVRSACGHLVFPHLQQTSPHAHGNDPPRRAYASQIFLRRHNPAQHGANRTFSLVFKWT